jgi:hypothetical protein
VSNQLTANLDGLEALTSVSISKSEYVKPDMLQLVDTYIVMISQQYTFYDRMTKGVETFGHHVYAQYREIKLQSQMFPSHVKGGRVGIAAHTSHNY